MSKTPRTDNLAMISDELGISEAGYLEESVDLCRRLETELAEARAEIERQNNGHNLLFNTFSQLIEEHEALKEELSERDKLIEQMRETLRLALAEIAVLKAALWYFGNSLGPDVAEELENALPERLSRKINLTEIENTNGEAALEAADGGE